MSSHKGSKKEKGIQIENFSLEKKLQSLGNKDMYDLVQTLMEKKQKFEN